MSASLHASALSARAPSRPDAALHRRLDGPGLGLVLPGDPRRARPPSARPSSAPCASPSPRAGRAFPGYHASGQCRALPISGASPSAASLRRLYTLLLNFGEMTVSAGPAAFIINANPDHDRRARHDAPGRALQPARLDRHGCLLRRHRRSSHSARARCEIGLARCSSLAPPSATLSARSCRSRCSPATSRSRLGLEHGHRRVRAAAVPAQPLQAQAAPTVMRFCRGLSRHRAEPHRLRHLGHRAVAPAGLPALPISCMRAAGGDADRLPLARRDADAVRADRRRHGAGGCRGGQSEALNPLGARKTAVIPGKRSADPGSIGGLCARRRIPDRRRFAACPG